MDEIHRRMLNSCLVILTVISLFMSIVFITGAIILILGLQPGGL
jgi:hypothetical protein